MTIVIWEIDISFLIFSWNFYFFARTKKCAKINICMYVSYGGYISFDIAIICPIFPFRISHKYSCEYGPNLVRKSAKTSDFHPTFLSDSTSTTSHNFQTEVRTNMRLKSEVSSEFRLEMWPNPDSLVRWKIKLAPALTFLKDILNFSALKTRYDNEWTDIVHVCTWLRRH